MLVATRRSLNQALAAARLPAMELLGYGARQHLKDLPELSSDSKVPITAEQVGHQPPAVPQSTGSRVGHIVYCAAILHCAMVNAMPLSPVCISGRLRVWWTASKHSLPTGRGASVLVGIRRLCIATLTSVGCAAGATIAASTDKCRLCCRGYNCPLHGY